MRPESCRENKPTITVLESPEVVTFTATGSVSIEEQTTSNSESQVNARARREEFQVAFYLVNQISGLNNDLIQISDKVLIILLKNL